MGIYFGTDGFRGIYGESLSPAVAYRVGNSLARLCNKSVLIGRDTRQSGCVLTSAFASGLMAGGINVVDIGIAPTPAIAYITKKYGFEYGVVISASHNPKEYNGIKIFDKNGFKIDEKLEDEIERKLLQATELSSDNLGHYKYIPKLKNSYKASLSASCNDLSGLKIGLDLANGASYEIAKGLFKQKGATVYTICSNPNGKNINLNCGALYPQNISSLVKDKKCDMGFAFDGDADRIIACDENGSVLDGDDLIYLLAQHYPSDKIIGTSMTNKGLELALNKQGKQLLRADVGDKYVSQMMREQNATIGGETSGHIINFNYSTTGDGVLTALTVADIVKSKHSPLSSLLSFKHFPPTTISVSVVDKFRILNSDSLRDEILHFQSLLEKDGRLLVRASGTENKIRIMCECEDEKKANAIAEKIKQSIINIDQEKSAQKGI